MSTSHISSIPNQGPIDAKQAKNEMAEMGYKKPSKADIQAYLKERNTEQVPNNNDTATIKIEKPAATKSEAIKALKESGNKNPTTEQVNDYIKELNQQDLSEMQMDSLVESTLDSEIEEMTQADG